VVAGQLEDRLPSAQADRLSPDLYVMNADGTAETPATTTSHGRAPAWSPDARIAFRGACPFFTSHIYTAPDVAMRRS
jgi:hypothetical protein